MWSWLGHLFPYTDFNQINLDWMLEQFGIINSKIDKVDETYEKALELEEQIESAVETTSQNVTASAENAATAGRYATAAQTSAEDAKELVNAIEAKQLNLMTFKSVTELGLASGATLTSIYQAMPAGSLIVIPSSEIASADAPAFNSVIFMARSTNTGRGVVLAQTTNGFLLTKSLSGDGSITGDWFSTISQHTDVDVVLEANPGVAPFSHYGAARLTRPVGLFAVSAECITSSSGNVVVCNVGATGYLTVYGTKAETVTVRVTWNYVI